MTDRHVVVRTLHLAPLTVTLLLGACQHPQQLKQPEASPAAVPLLSSQAQACGSESALHAPVLRLPPTDAPRRAPKARGNDIAQIHTVNRPLQEIGVWTDLASGWSVLALTVGSEGARSIAVRLHEVRLPPHSALWLCAADGESSQGPYAAAPDGEIWSAPVSAAQARIEVWTPTATRDGFGAALNDVYGGYQR